MEIEQLTLTIREAIRATAAAASRERVWVAHYGANHIHPRHLVYWVCVESDAEKARLAADADLMRRLRELLVTHDYPAEGREGVHIGFESKETVDRESGGSFFYHWK